MKMTISDWFLNLAPLEVLESILPFILIFTLIYAIQLKARILGDKKSVHVTIALGVALTVVIPHIVGTYPPGEDIVLYINAILPYTGLVLIGFLMIIVLAGVFGVEVNWKTIIFSLIILELIIPESLFIAPILEQFFPGIGNILGRVNVSIFLLVVIVMITFIWYIMQEEPEEKTEED